MARKPRNDSPGAWFHVMNRGIARRTLFETAADIRLFLDQLGEATDRNELEIHAFALMTTHYHLLVRSPLGRLGKAMQQVQTGYSRFFNRSRKRDGPLVRGRYASKEVDSHTYRCAVVRYIDFNPVSAGIVPLAVDYPYGSARHYARQRSEGAEWLDRSWIEREVRERLVIPAYDPGRYTEVFGRLPGDLARLVEARLASHATHDPIDDLVRAAPDKVLEWMKRKANLADGTLPGLPAVTPESLDAAVDSLAATESHAWRIGRRDGWLVLRVALTRSLCGLGVEEIGARVGAGRSAVSAMSALHARLLATDARYCQRSAAIASQALRVWKAEESD